MAGHRNPKNLADLDVTLS